MIQPDNSTKDTTRCGWLNNNQLYITYHDEEWGVPEYNNIRLFEMFCLGGQQAGLSWLTVLKKRENYRKLFHGFDPQKISKFSDEDVKRILNNPGIIRNKRKIEAIINNSKCFLKMQENGEDFSKFLWSFVDNRPIINNWICNSDIPSETPVSIAMSKALKQKGFTYIGSTICYATMQACGLVNDHIASCVSRNKIIGT